MSVMDELGAHVGRGGTAFAVWAPTHRRVELVLADGRRVDAARGDDGVFRVRVEGIGAGARYRYSLDGGSPMPDPASRFQPEGVHGPSEVVDPSSYAWRDAGWRGVAMRDLVIYELNVGAFTPDGTFDAARERLPELAELGVTAIELMPVHDFPGRRGWGYDPAALFAPCRAYGTPDDLRRLVDDAHAAGLAVLLDVVYNHLGPDGAYFAAYGPVLTERHATPWGRAVNLDGPCSRGVRDIILGNALCWLREYHLDGLRLDATFALVDDSEPHLLAELSEVVSRVEGWRRILIAEDDRHLARLLEPREQGGHGLDGVWMDDFHHLVRRIVTGERHGYFAGFPDSTEALAVCIERSWYRERADASHLDRSRFVFYIQTHDQIGNRAMGDRITEVIDLATYRAISALLAFVPQTPLLFMGQEHAASTPFRYFTDHEPELGRKVREGRTREFQGSPGFDGDVPDPQSGATFGASVLDWGERRQTPCCEVLRLYRDLLALRRELPPFTSATSPAPGLLLIRRGARALALSLGASGSIPIPRRMRVLLDTEEAAYGGRAQSIGAARARASVPEHAEPACQERERDVRFGPEIEGSLTFDGPRALVLEEA